MPWYDINCNDIVNYFQDKASIQPESDVGTSNPKNSPLFNDKYQDDNVKLIPNLDNNDDPDAELHEPATDGNCKVISLSVSIIGAFILLARSIIVCSFIWCQLKLRRNKFLTKVLFCYHCR